MYFLGKYKLFANSNNIKGKMSIYKTLQNKEKWINPQDTIL